MFRTMRGMIAAFLMGAVAVGMSPQVAHGGQDFPDRPVKLVVASPAGSSSDVLSRKLANELGAKWKQPVVVENVVGLGGIIGAEKVAKQAPDGYTLLVGTISAMSVGRSLMKLPYDPTKDFEPVTLGMSMPNLLVVHPSVPAKTLEELVAYAKQNPGKLRYGHPGVGTTPHLSAELLNEMTGMQMEAIPYKSSAQMATDLLAGHYEVLFHNSSVMMPYVQSGAARPLAVTSAERVSTLPNIPTVAESGKLKGFVVNAWWGIHVPAGTPADIVAKLNTDFNAALAQPDIRKWVEEQGGVVGGGTPEALFALQESEAKKWGDLIKKLNVKNP